MGKVLVERPRPGSRWGSRPRKGYQKEVRRAMEAGDGGPTREGITRRYQATRPFNEHLGPLRRFLQSNVGRPWDKVYSEIAAHIDRGNVVQKHILTHLFDYVVTKTAMIDGVPCLATRFWPGEYGQPLREVRTHRPRWYVCPRSGLLKAFARGPRYRYRPPSPKPLGVVRLTDSLAYRVTPAGVELIRLAPLPDLWEQKRGFDVLLNRGWTGLTGELVYQTYGRRVYAVEKWIATRRELKQYPVPFELTR